jgi:hypothetical protein
MERKLRGKKQHKHRRNLGAANATPIFSKPLFG